MKRTPRIWVASAVVTVLSGAVGGLFGDLSNAAYGHFDGPSPEGRFFGIDAGLFLGIAAGVVVAVGWSRFMLGRSDAEWERGVGKKLVAAPVRYGVVAGMIATILLHVGMAIEYGVGGLPMGLVVGEFLAVIAGAFVGAIGALCWPPVPKAPPAP